MGAFFAVSMLWVNLNNLYLGLKFDLNRILKKLKFCVLLWEKTGSHLTIL